MWVYFYLLVGICVATAITLFNGHYHVHWDEPIAVFTFCVLSWSIVLAVAVLSK